MPPRFSTAACVVIALFLGSSAERARAQGGSQTDQTNQNQTGQTAGTTQQTAGMAGSGSTYGTGTAATAGTAGALQGPQFQRFGEAPTQANQSGFIGRGNTDQFIGAQIPGQQQANRQGQFQQLQFNQFGTLGTGRGGRRQTTTRGRGTTTLSRAARMRPRHRVAFDFQPLGSETVRTNLTSRFRIPDVNLEGVNVAVDSAGTATLSGTANSDDTRKLAAILARLEPGVRKVDNQIQVQAATATD